MAQAPYDPNPLRRRAEEVAKQKQFDYAIQIYRQILEAIPGSMPDRKAVRTLQRLKAQDAGKGAPKGGMFGGFGGMMMGKGALLKLEAMKKTSKPETLIAECEKILDSEPSNAAVLKTLGITASQLEWTDTAIWSLEDAYSLDPTDTELLRYLGRVYYDKDRHKAVNFWEKLKKAKPEDREAAGAIRDLSARIAMEQGVEQAGKTGDFHDMLKDKKGTQRLEEQQKFLKTGSDVDKAILRTKEDIKAKPTDSRLWAKLGDLFLQNKNFHEARQAYTKASSIDPANDVFKMKIGEATLKELDGKLDEAETAARAAPGDAELKQKAETMRKERTVLHLQELGKQTKAHPTDLDLRFRYGDALLKAGRVREAIGEFQQSVNDPRRRKASLRNLGMGFMHEGMLELAESQLMKVAQEVGSTGEEGKEISYLLGSVCKKQEKYQKAKEWLMKVYEVDINYKDVADQMKEIEEKIRSAKAQS